MRVNFLTIFVGSGYSILRLVGAHSIKNNTKKQTDKKIRFFNTRHILFETYASIHGIFSYFVHFYFYFYKKKFFLLVIYQRACTLRILDV